MTSEKIIRSTSKRVTCTNLEESIFLANSDRVIERSGRKAALRDASSYIKLNFNLLHENFSQLNYEHDESIINGINIRVSKNFCFVY